MHRGSRAPRGRRVLAAALVLGAIAAPGTVARARAADAGAPTTSSQIPVLVINGRGFGHGVGMAQDGAYWMGREGASTEQILGQFYPGTALGQDRSANQADPLVRVAVVDAGAAPTSAAVAFPEGGEVLDALGGPQSPGFPVIVGAGGSVTLAWDGNLYSVSGGTPAAASATPSPSAPKQDGLGVRAPNQAPRQAGSPITPRATTASTLAPPSLTTTTTTTPQRGGHQPGNGDNPPSGPPPATPPKPSLAPGPPAGASSARPLWAVPTSGGHAGQGTTTVLATGRTYRGTIEAAGTSGELGLVNQVVVEDYLKGMGEVLDPSWPQASLRAQAIAARTYALRAMQNAGQICDDQRCQVYLGAQMEYAAMDRAVDDTRGEVVVAGGRYAATVYSANAGGFTASRLEGFGTADDGSYPYLRPAPYPTNDPDPWTLTASLADVAARLGYPGTLTTVTVAQRGPSHRALTVVLGGTRGTMTTSGIDFAGSLGLRSTLFTLQTALASAAPPPLPPPGSAPSLQLLPGAADQAMPPSPPGAPNALDPPSAPAGSGRHDLAVGAPRAIPLPASEPIKSLPSWAVVIAVALVILALSLAPGAIGARARQRVP